MRASSRPLSLLAGLAAAAALSACEKAAVPPALPAATVADDRPYEVALQPPPAARAGTPAAARVVLRARGSFHVNRDYPMAFRPDPASVAAVGAERVALADIAVRTPCAAHPEEACEVAAPIPFTPPAAGEATLGGTIAFSVCNPELCRIEKVPLSVAFRAGP